MRACDRSGDNQASTLVRTVAGLHHQNEPKAFAAAKAGRAQGVQELGGVEVFLRMGVQARAAQLAAGIGGDSVDPALGGGGYIEILRSLEGADH
jgi:hypothetical protein